jgi:hypothetical protein
LSHFACQSSILSIIGSDHIPCQFGFNIHTHFSPSANGDSMYYHPGKLDSKNLTTQRENILTLRNIFSVIISRYCFRTYWKIMVYLIKSLSSFGIVSSQIESDPIQSNQITSHHITLHHITSHHIKSTLFALPESAVLLLPQPRMGCLHPALPPCTVPVMRTQSLRHFLFRFDRRPVPFLFRLHELLGVRERAGGVQGVPARGRVQCHH